jgi:hypothetical protein
LKKFCPNHLDDTVSSHGPADLGLTGDKKIIWMIFFRKKYRPNGEISPNLVTLAFCDFSLQLLLLDFLMQYIKPGENIPINQQIYQMVINYMKSP